MTDQMIPAGLTRDEAQAVREWAEQALAVEVQDETVVHAARVLLAVLPTPPTTAKENPELPDQTLDDQVRPIVAAMRAAMRRDEHAYPEAKFLADLSGYIKDLEALLAQRPTLADMTDEELAACKRMQADVAGHSTRYVILDPSDEDGEAALIDPDGRLAWTFPDYVTPRPDLPRLEWPGDQKPEPEPAPALPGDWRLADHPDHGCVIVANPTPNRAGNVCFVMPAVDGDPRGFTWHICSPNALTYLDTEPEEA